MTMPRAVEELGAVTKNLDEVIKRLTKAPLDTEELASPLQAAAEKLESALLSDQSIWLTDVSKALVAGIQQRSHQVKHLLDSAVALSFGLTCGRDGSSIAEEISNPAGWHMDLEA